MEISAIQTDKVLLTVFVSVLVGFITAALSIVRLVNDKENKTTDYRQSWNDSLRKSFAELISNVNLLSSSITNRLSALDKANGIANHVISLENGEQNLPQSVVTLRDYYEKKLVDEDSHIRELRKNLHQSYALTTLHFKPNDLSFSRVEQKFDVIIEMLDRLASLKGVEVETERFVLSEKIKTAAAEIAGYSRDILKTEWEAVKKGERAYQQTKKWSLVGGAIAFFVLLSFGAVTAWNMARRDANASSVKLSGHPAGQASLQVSAGATTASTSPIPSSNPQNSQVFNVYPPARYLVPSGKRPQQTKPEHPICSEGSK